MKQSGDSQDSNLKILVGKLATLLARPMSHLWILIKILSNK